MGDARGLSTSTSSSPTDDPCTTTSPVSYNNLFVLVPILTLFPVNKASSLEEPNKPAMIDTLRAETVMIETGIVETIEETTTDLSVSAVTLFQPPQMSLIIGLSRTPKLLS